MNRHFLKSYFSRDYVRVCFLSTFLFGILAHGLALTNKFSVADELHLGFTVGSTIVSGRWFLEILGGIVRWIFGSPNFSLPITGGLLTILFTALCSCVVISWMELKRKTTWVLISGLMITFPIMSGLFFYNFTAPYYMFALLLIFLGAAWLCKKRNPCSFAGGIVLITLGVSVYQAFIPLFLSLLLIYFIREVDTAEHWSLKHLLREMLWYCGACMIMISLYFLSVKLSTSLTQQELLSYKGISSMGSAGIADYLQRIKLAIYLFLFPTRCGRYAFIFPYRLVDCYFLTLALSVLMGVINIARCLPGKPAKALSLALALVFFPLASNFIYIMCAQEDIYTLMQFGLLAPFLLLACQADWAASNSTILLASRKAAVFVLCIFSLFSIRMDNAVYTKGIYVQTRAQSYFTTLIAQIKSTPGYTSKTPVAYIGDNDICIDPTFQRIDGFGALTMAPLPHDATPFCVGHFWQEFLDFWCGFKPPAASPEDFENLPEVAAMPTYPNSGSIRMIGDTLVVKFQEQAN